MRMSSLVMPLILFTGLYMGIQNFGMDLYSNSGMEAEGLTTIEEEHENLSEKWVRKGGDKSTFRDEQGIVERATGAIMIPRIVDSIMDVGVNINQVIGEVADYRWVPDWADTMVRTMITASVFFALVSAYLRWRA